MFFQKDKDSGTNSLLGRWSQKTTIKEWGGETRKERHPIRCVLSRKTSLCGTSAWSHWRTLETSVEYIPYSYPTQGVRNLGNKYSKSCLSWIEDCSKRYWFSSTSDLLCGRQSWPKLLEKALWQRDADAGNGIHSGRISLQV